MALKVLTFNLHSQYLYLLSHTGWDIDNLVIPPTNPPGWHSQPYGYPTFSPAVHPVPGYDYYSYFPDDWTAPPDPAVVPPVKNIRNVLIAEKEYDLIIYIERDSLAFYDGPARKKVMVNLIADGFSPNGYVDEVVGHVRNISGTTFIPMGGPDNYLPRHPDIDAILLNYAAGRWRPHLINQMLLKTVADAFPLHIHDMVEELWDYKTLKKVLSRFLIYFSPVMMTGGPPLACVEAFMAGMPVILHDPHNHFAAFTGTHCMRVDHEWQVALAATSLWNIREMGKELGEAGREKAREAFNINRFVQGWQEVAVS